MFSFFFSTKRESSHAFLTPGIYNIMVEALNDVSSAIFELGTTYNAHQDQYILALFQNLL